MRPGASVRIYRVWDVGPTRKRGPKITTRGVSEGQRWQPRIQCKVSQHAFRASGTCHPTPEFIPDKGYVHSRRCPSFTPRVVMGGRFASSPLPRHPVLTESHPMLLSMTGHGQASRRFADYSIDVEIRTVNNRFLKVSTRISEQTNSLESELEGLVRQFLKRGSVSLSIRIGGNASSEVGRVNQSLLQQYTLAAKEAAQAAKVPCQIDMGTLMGLPGVLNTSVSEENKELNEAILQACQAALEDLQEMRQREGDAMGAKFRDYVDGIRELQEVIATRAPQVVAEYQIKLEQRIRSAIEARGMAVDSIDLLREITLFCDKADIAEELTRLQSHLVQFESALHHPESQGRRLDFLVQELGRETNTIGSKANDAEITNSVVTIKTILEQIRELVQNVE